MRVGGAAGDGRRADREGRPEAARRWRGQAVDRVGRTRNGEVTACRPDWSCRVMLAGAAIDGGVVSWTVTLKVAVAVLLPLSVAVQLTVVVPIGKVEPEAGAHVTGSVPSTTSVAVAVNVTAAPPGQSLPQ